MLRWQLATFENRTRTDEEAQLETSEVGHGFHIGCVYISSLKASIRHANVQLSEIFYYCNLSNLKSFEFFTLIRGYCRKLFLKYSLT